MKLSEAELKKETVPENNTDKEDLHAAFIGNPNCGKTTLFNAYTGAKLKVANWPGVTVEKKEGAFKYHDDEFKLVDLPGIYSLTSYSMEEKLSRKYILDDEVDVIVDVVDASTLERNLYLTLQLLELGKPVVVALNMMDIVQERGMEIDLHRMPEMLGVPVIPVSARKKSGLDVLIHAIAHHSKSNRTTVMEHHHPSKSKHEHNHHKEWAMVYSDDIEDKIDLVAQRVEEVYPEYHNLRWAAIKLLEHDNEVMSELDKVDISDIVPKSLENEITRQKYDFIEEIMNECMVNRENKAQQTAKIDAVLTHRIWGVPIFLGIIAAVFMLTFSVGGILGGVLGNMLDAFSGIVVSTMTSIGVNDMVISLIADGIISGVGGILTFLPNIFILFLALAFLEDSGYMARVAYVMDSIMGKLGLSGKAFIPMLLGFGCTVPAIMASRTLENQKDRLKTILVTPFMSCSARMPVYVLFSGMFFGKYASLAAFSMYVLGMLTAILIAKIMTVIEKKSSHESASLLIELPEYKTPNARSIAIYVWEKVKDYLTKAGTTIFVASVIVWVMLNFGIHGPVMDMSNSFGAMLGRLFVPMLSTAGLGYWQIAVALISGIAAKEVVVSSMSVLYGIGNISSAEGMAEAAGTLALAGFGALNAYSMMVFCLLYVPCAASIATIRSETKSLKWTVFAVLFQLGLAWLVSTLIYTIGGLFI